MALLRATLIASLAVWAAAPALASPAADTVATAFCEAVRASDEAAAEALMTPELQAAIARLRQTDAAFRTAHPDEKPPLGDGLRLTAFPDGLQSCTPEAVAADSAVLVYAPGIDPAAQWRDRLVLVPAPDGRVLVADILYAPDQTAGFAAWLAEASTWK
jgi:hypothetical protein